MPYWHTGALWDRNDNPCVPFQRPSRERRQTCRSRQRACLEHADALLEPLLESFQRSHYRSHRRSWRLLGRRWSLGARHQPSPHTGSALANAGQGRSFGLRVWKLTLSEGYQGGAWGSSGTGRQRQSGGSPSSNVVGRSLPADRCATAVSTLSTALHWAIRFKVSFQSGLAGCS